LPGLCAINPRSNQGGSPINKRIALCLTAAAISIAWATGAQAANITACQTLSVPGAYVLQVDVNTCGGSCFIIAADGVTLDLNYNTANGNCAGCPYCEDMIGIGAGTFSSVAGNTANNNQQEGMQVGLSSLVTNNTANGNGSVGIEVDCPSTATNNHSNTGYSFPGTGCFLKNNL
jgi:hypothetical protein